MNIKICILACLSLGAISAESLHSQNLPTASRRAIAQIGGAFTFAYPDFTATKIKGVGFYGDYDPLTKLGLEIAVHNDDLWTPENLGQSSYLAGPRYRFRHRGVTPYAKILFGFGVFSYHAGNYLHIPPSSTHSWVVSVGGGIDYPVSKSVVIRPIDVEFQRWPSFNSHGLTPVVLSFGAAYRF